MISPGAGHRLLSSLAISAELYKPAGLAFGHLMLADQLPDGYPLGLWGWRFTPRTRVSLALFAFNSRSHLAADTSLLPNLVPHLAERQL